MKAYAVVRKPLPTNNSVQHSFKLQKRDPPIVIENIQENSFLTPRRQEIQISNHLIERQSIHFKFDDTLTEFNRTSKSPGKKHPIFQTRQFGKGSEKQANQNKPLNESKDNQKIMQTPVFSYRDSRASNKQEVKSDLKVNQQKPQILSTPQKQKEQKQFMSPYDILNASFGGQTINLTRQFPRRNTIFGENTRVSRSKSKNNKNNLVQTHNFSQRSTYHRQSEQVNQKQQNIKIQNHPPIQTINQRNQKVNSTQIKNIEFQKQQINLGCCGQQVQRQSEKPHQLNHTSYTNHNQRQKIVDSNSTYVIKNSIVQSFLPTSSSKKQNAPPQKKITSQFNPETSFTQKKSNTNYKDDKISSKPMVNQNNRKEEKNSELAKSRKVTVFQVASIKPFQF